VASTSHGHEAHVYQPPEFVIDGQEDKVMRLDKALYGLRQALHAWNTKLDEMLAALRFSHSASEHAIYARVEGTSQLLVGVYVDDLIITWDDATDISVFKQQMSTRFDMSDLGLLSFYLDVEVQKRGDDISLSQAAYT
jgi:uncharacterized protein (DUF1499 family)